MNALEARSAQRWAQAMVYGVMACLLALVALAVTHTYRNVFRPPPFFFTSEVYPPLRGDVCPGDVVEYRPRLVVTRTPSLIVVVRTLWGVSEQRTLVPDTEPKFFVWTDQEQGHPVSRVVSYRLPPDLPVGFYEIRGAATALNSDSAAYRVPFVIAESCFKKGAP